MKAIRFSTAVTVAAFGGLTLYVEDPWARATALILAVGSAVFLGMLLEDAGEVDPPSAR